MNPGQSSVNEICNKLPLALPLQGEPARHSACRQFAHVSVPASLGDSEPPAAYPRISFSMAYSAATPSIASNRERCDS